MFDDDYKADIEETEEFVESDPVDLYAKKQRELVTSVVDYNLSTLVDLVVSESIDLSPDYQRRFRWDPARQSKLIESFLMNVPIPPIFLNEDKYGRYSVIDGKQRLNAVVRFLRGQLELEGLQVFSDINGKTFEDLPRDLQTAIKTRPTLRAVIILRQSDAEIKFEVFQRLNTGGVRLNPQEIRNSTYTGSLNDLIIKLSTHKKFHKLLGIKDKEKSKIYKEMRDAELVLRFFTFRNSWGNFQRLKPAMDTFMNDNRHMSEVQLSQLKEDFLQTLDVVEAAFGQNAFKRWMPSKGIWKNQVLASLYDAQIFACRGLNAADVRNDQSKILHELKLLFVSDDFRKSIDAATNNPVQFRGRIETVRAMLTTAIRE